MSGNASAFTVGNPNAPDGTQVAFIKNNGSISQTVYLDAGVYNLSFLAAQRVNYQTQNQEIEVLIDGAEVGADRSRKHHLRRHTKRRISR